MKKFTKMILLVLLAAFSVNLAAGTAAKANISNVKPVKYVFLFIGDGMSIPQRMTAEEFSKKIGSGKLFINSMPYQAVTTTNSANAFITDSAASGTAIACGEKTLNYVIGMAADRKRKLESVAELAKKSGRKVGIISSVTINHATPAAFYAHNADRGNAYSIALDLINSNFDYFGGGGVSSNNDTKNKNYKGNIYDLAAKAGYTVAHGAKAIKAIKPGTPKVFAVGAPGALPYAIDRSSKDLALAEYVAQAIKLLDNEKGFFIMAEGGKIDWVGHSNDAATNIREVIDLDQAVKVAYEFALKHPNETLIVVTGDHETGGMTLGFAGTGYSSFIENIKYQKCSAEAFGRKIHEFRKKPETSFDEIKKLITANYGLVFPGEGTPANKRLLLSANEAKQLEAAYKSQFKNGKYYSNNAIAKETTRIFGNKCSIGWTTGAHTALPVITTAWGRNGELFSNFIDNTDIAKRLKLVVR